MNEQESQKLAFKNWNDLNKNSLSLDHKNGHQQGWDDAIEWIKQGQEPVAEVCFGFILDYRKQIIKVSSDERLPIGLQLYTNPQPPQKVTELIEALELIREMAVGFPEDLSFYQIADKALSKLESKK